MRKILVFSLIVVFVVICCIPCSAASYSPVDPLTEAEYQFECFENSDGSSVVYYSISPAQMYKFDLWSQRDVDHIGEFVNESREFMAGSVCGDVRPFLNDSDQIHLHSSGKVSSGFYMPIDNERRPDSITFDFGFNLKNMTGKLGYNDHFPLSGQFVLYLVTDRADGVTIVEKKVFSDLTYTRVPYEYQNTVEYRATVTFDFMSEPIDYTTVHGFIPFFTFDDIELDHDASMIFFPFFNFEYYTSAASNLRYDMIDLGVIEGDLQGISTQGFDFVNSIFASWDDVFMSAGNSLAVCSFFIDGLSSIPAIRDLIVVSLGVGIVAALFGFVFEYLRRK